MRHTFVRIGLALLTAVSLSATVSAQRGAPAGPQQTSTPEPLKFRYMGPAPAGRIASAAGVPGDPKTYYLGSASGGVWKSTDSGQTFVPIFDDQAVAAIGSIAVADSDPNIVWVGTGEPWVIRYSDVMGDGVYKSTDAGKTWKHMGLPETGRISRVLIHPTDPEHRLRVRAGAPHRTAGRARRVQDDRRRRDVEARAVRGPQHELLGPRARQERPEHADRRHVAGRAAHVGRVQRRAGQRRLHHA